MKSDCHRRHLERQSVIQTQHWKGRTRDWNHSECVSETKVTYLKMEHVYRCALCAEKVIVMDPECVHCNPALTRGTSDESRKLERIRNHLKAKPTT